ncbi:hypothetical protein H6F89_28455 [Cyanobacteria bacterium FACHB-63]|nr:hypothetical protein [Cyanobacteria bacterium FACHB-63]
MAHQFSVLATLAALGLGIYSAVVLIQRSESRSNIPSDQPMITNFDTKQ